MKVEVLKRQSVLDLAIQETGDVMNAFEIAKENSLAVSDYLTAGYELIIPNGMSFNRDVLNYYSSKKITPATDITNTGEGDVQELEGISIWIINKNFIVQ